MYMISTIASLYHKRLRQHVRSLSPTPSNMILHFPCVPSYFHHVALPTALLYHYYPFPSPSLAFSLSRLPSFPIAILGSRGTTLSKAPTRSHAVAATEKIKTHTATRKLGTGFASNDAPINPAKASNFV